MNVLIIEDEPRAANRLARLITQLEPRVIILAKLASIQSSVNWLKENPSPDLIFMDVRLEDGDCFEIFKQTTVDSPIVFSTAYSEYALQAFAVNSIDYVLKPVTRSQLKKALDKFQKFLGYRMSSTAWPDFTVESAYQRQFLVALAGKFVPVQIEQIVAAKSYLKSTQLIDDQGRQWLLDQGLKDVGSCLDPANFFQVSRQWIVNLDRLLELYRSGDGYLVKIASLSEPVQVSRARVKPLKFVLSNR